jgi:two-component system KDP operon response regulator KdpE
MTCAMHRVLVLEDDRSLRRVLTRLFESEDFRVVSAATCELGIQAAQSQRPDICVADLSLPDRDGLFFIRQVRAWSAVPIIVLTACAEEAQRLTAFESGADDYVTKPFSTTELLARVHAILRRRVRYDQSHPTLRLGTASIDLARRSTRGPDGEEKHLTPLEHRILECLVRHSDATVTYAQLMQEVWGPRQTDLRGLRVYITSLRRKLEADPAQPRHILTEPSVGYRLATEIRERPPVNFPALCGVPGEL